MDSRSQIGPRPFAHRWKWAAWLCVAAGFVATAVYFKLPARAQGWLTQLQVLLTQLLEWLATLGVWGPVLYILLYIVSCLALLPASLLTIGAGAVFGVVRGSILVNIGATLGAAAAFLVGRFLARGWVERKIAGHPAFASIDRAVAADGWKIVLLTRLSPAFPFFLFNYGYGLTRVSFRHYFFATWLGIIPGSTLFVYIGSLANPNAAGAGALVWAFRIIGLIATVLVTIYITRIAQRALARKTGELDPARPNLPP